MKLTIDKSVTNDRKFQVKFRIEVTENEQKKLEINNLMDTRLGEVESIWAGFPVSEFIGPGCAPKTQNVSDALAIEKQVQADCQALMDALVDAVLFRGSTEFIPVQRAPNTRHSSNDADQLLRRLTDQVEAMMQEIAQIRKQTRIRHLTDQVEATAQEVNRIKKQTRTIGRDITIGILALGGLLLWKLQTITYLLRHMRLY